MPDVLLYMAFPGGEVYYDHEFKVTIKGFVYPRQLKTAAELVRIYKEFSKEDNWEQTQAKALSEAVG